MWKDISASIAGIFGMSHQAKIVRKPEGVGAEFKSVADAQSGFILTLDIIEGQERNAAKKYNNLGAETGKTLRLTRPWHGTNRVVVRDSWFASFLTAFELWCVGISSMGILKTASRFSRKKTRFLVRRKQRLEE
jgi:hypothetical protein